MSRRDEIRARLEAATPGPWRPLEFDLYEGFAAVLGGGPAGSASERQVALCVQRGCDPRVSDADLQADADLIAHAPADLRDLLAVAEAAREVGPPECEDCYEEDCTGNDEGRCPCGDVCHPEQITARMDLRAALARFDAVTGGER